MDEAEDEGREGRGGGTKEVGGEVDEREGGLLLEKIFMSPPTPPTLFLFLRDDLGGVGRGGAEAIPSVDESLSETGVLRC